MIYRLLADFIAAVHFGYVFFVLFGLILTLVGHAAGWKWVNNRWFRIVHLGMILGVVARTLIWSICPLTWWEEDLRALAGQVNFEGSPVGWFFHAAIHPDLPLWVFPRVYACFALLVVLSLWLVPV